MEVHAREDFLAGGTGGPTAAARTEEQERAVPTPDGGCVVAEVASVRALGPAAACAGCSPTPRGTGRPDALRPAVSPDGRLVSVVVPALEPDKEKAALVYDLEPDRNYTWDDLLLLEAATGEVLGRRQIRSPASAAVQSWRPDGGAVVVSCWTAWHSWSTWWAEPRAPTVCGSSAARGCGRWRDSCRAPGC